MGAGASMKKSDTPAGIEENKKISKEVRSIIDQEYETYFKSTETITKETFPKVDFYRAVCEIVEKLNEKHDYTQLNMPSAEELKDAFNKKHPKEGKLTKEQFESIISELIRRARVTGFGVKETLIYIFGVPVTALLIKNAIMPRVISDQILLPAVTSATALVLAKRNKM